MDIGGSNIKAAPVDVTTGRICAPPYRVPTPTPTTPGRLGDALVEVSDHFGWAGRVGCTFPGPIVASLVRDAGYLDTAWLGQDAGALLAAGTGQAVTVLNDADAAGIAEMRFGAGRGVAGTVIVLTFGTGIGSALFRDGVLVPNTEFGILPMASGSAESFASARTRSVSNLSYAEWATRVSAFIQHLDSLLYPELVVIGGAISSAWDEFADQLDVTVPVVPADMVGDAGIVGAAMFSADALAAQPAAEPEPAQSLIATQNEAVTMASSQPNHRGNQ